jgi:hypothetical protein
MLSDAKEQHRAWELKQQFFQKKKPPPQQKKKPDFRPAAHQTPVLWTMEQSLHRLQASK